MRRLQTWHRIARGICDPDGVRARVLKTAPIVALCVLLIGACGDGDSAEQQPAATPPPAAAPAPQAQQPGAIPPDVPLRATRAGDPAAIKVIRLWSDALRRSRVTRASSFWAVPSKVQNDTPVLTLATASDVRAFNGSLPCGSRLVSARGAPRGFTIAVFKLTRRPGATCGSGIGHAARAAILVRGGKIAEWYRLPNDPDAPAPQGPAAPQERNAPVI